MEGKHLRAYVRSITPKFQEELHGVSQTVTHNVAGHWGVPEHQVVPHISPASFYPRARAGEEVFTWMAQGSGVDGKDLLVA